MAEKLFSIERTVPTVYLDKGGQAVNGYTVTFVIYGYDEQHELHLPSLQPAAVEKAILQVVEYRKKLAALGS